MKAVDRVARVVIVLVAILDIAVMVGAFALAAKAVGDDDWDQATFWLLVMALTWMRVTR